MIGLFYEGVEPLFPQPEDNGSLVARLQIPDREELPHLLGDDGLAEEKEWPVGLFYCQGPGSTDQEME